MGKIKDFLLSFSCVQALQRYRFKKKWRKNNPNNYTFPINIFNMKNINIGDYTYGPLYIKDFGNKNTSLTIGMYCSIAENVKFLLAGEHDYHNISTYPFKVKLLGEECESLSKGPIVVEDDVWIGHNALILSGVKIGQGAVIGANSVVTKNVPPYSIWCGTKVIKYRFSDEVISKLNKVDYKKIKFNKEKIDYFYEKVDEKNIDDLIKKIYE